ncbi:hypothetical protein B0T13DRAFT_310591 [Neurospora crassa]|nr:hypothetical protein B0T13DRAFT_310591 [Neurospora crassa]
MGWSFGRKKNKEAAPTENPYAQQPSADPYANQYASPAQSQSTLSSTASSGPSPYQNQQAPPPYSAGGPVQQPPAAGRYTNERFGTTDKYGDNRYDTPSSSHQNPYAPSTSANYNSGVSAQPSLYKQQYPVTYGDNKQPGQIPPDGPQDIPYQPTPQEIYGNKFGVPEEELTEEQKQDLEVDKSKNEILRTHQDGLASLQRTKQTLDHIMASAAMAVENTARQGDSLDRVELNSIAAAQKAEKAGDATKYLGKLNDRPFFVPAVSRKGLREMDEKRIMDESMEKLERQKARAAQYQGKQAVQGIMPGQKRGLLGAKGSKKYDDYEVDDEARSKFTFEDDDGQQEEVLKQQFAIERELAAQMGTLHQVTVGLGEVLERQNNQIGRITENHDRTDDKLVRTRVKLDAMLR